MDIYWTAGGRIYLEDQLRKVPKFGVISLTNNSIIIYKKKSITGENFKEEAFIELPLKEVKDIEFSKMGIVEKTMLFYLTSNGYIKFQDTLEKIGLLTQYINTLENNTVMFYVNSNSEQELKQFEKQVKQKISHSSNFTNSI